MKKQHKTAIIKNNKNHTHTKKKKKKLMCSLKMAM